MKAYFKALTFILIVGLYFIISTFAIDFLQYFYFTLVTIFVINTVLNIIYVKGQVLNKNLGSGLLGH